MLLVSCAPITKYVTLPPCTISPFPTPPNITGYDCHLALDDKNTVDAVCYKVEDDYEFTKFIIQLARWRDEVRNCKSINETVVVNKDSFNKLTFAVMESFPN